MIHTIIFMVMLMIIIARELSNIGAVLNNFTADTRPGELLLKSNGNLQSPIIIIVLIISKLLYPSLCWNDAETDQHKEPMRDTKII